MLGGEERAPSWNSDKREAKRVKERNAIKGVAERGRG
jgi:hypothetical protein